MGKPHAFVTLVTTDQYLPGALALVAALRELDAENRECFETVCIVSPETVQVSTIKLLRRAFDMVVGVEVLGQDDAEKGLLLLGRPDLDTVLTKLHVFRLIQYSKIIFLDADVLPIRPLSHLFDLKYDFSAVPDVGWPDIFNSGVLVFSPKEGQFDDLRALLQSKGTWDGGDQGILNEWRGDDWNRLSFIYNTTPTGAYTYAPAYERFGSKISAIHFIGGNKPWSSLPYRAPGSATASKVVPSLDAVQAYDMGSLIDKWYAVYDRNYRSRAPADNEFEPKKYAAVWESQGEPISPGNALGLEALKELAIQGVNSSVSRGQPANETEGEYISMPVEGRVDLMRPKKIIKSTPAITRPIDLPSGETIRMDTLPTPGPHEIPPTPQLRGNSLPPVSPSTHHPRPESTRPFSPPMFSWDPAVDPPPTETPTASPFPSGNYHNVWDQHRNSQSGPTPDSNALFEAPPRTEIPQPLLLQGHYRQVTGDSGDGRGPSPDRRKVHAVFPWESQPRHTAGRVFPVSDSPIAGVSPPEDQTTPTVEAPKSRAHIDVRGLPASLTYANAWDTVPSIQKYASRLVRPPAPPIPPLDTAVPYSWDERTEASSRDGDDEEEEISSADDEDSDDGRGTARGSRKSSVSLTYVIKGKQKEYVVRGVQTMVKETRSTGVQVNTSIVPSPFQPKLKNPRPHIATTSPKPDPSKSDMSSGMRSPRDYNFQQVSESTPPPSDALPPLPRLVSSESILSPASTVGPLSPPDGTSLPNSPRSSTSGLPRKVGRVFDPARGVDVFKASSQEVLARFIRMGSFEDKA